MPNYFRDRDDIIEKETRSFERFSSRAEHARRQVLEPQARGVSQNEGQQRTPVLRPCRVGAVLKTKVSRYLQSPKKIFKHLKKLTLDNRRITYVDLERELGIGSAAIQTIIHYHLSLLKSLVVCTYDSALSAPYSAARLTSTELIRRLFFGFVW
ncbi:hypothetical protein EVAR_57650_1 [Eumeta japonica]|uniref:Uncharacterized protein n=1 Tax=Eumeta variegata TaxID=151549 RepID=A0A4C1ZCR2_EUMVA|nr:hypothetical protein EVAR_57650_1 [Eumeta japonica]